MKAPFLQNLIYFLFVIGLFSTCKKEKDTDPNEGLPKLSTTAVKNISSFSAETGGNISSDGGTPITRRGVCWGLATKPDTTYKRVSGMGIGSFTVTFADLLLPYTRYYYRAFAVNSKGLAYGQESSFVTLDRPEINSTGITVSRITSSTATYGVNVKSDGGFALTAVGLVWNTAPNPTVELSTKTNISTIPLGYLITETISGLAAGTKYYVRAYATNSKGTFYGQEQSFTTLAEGSGNGVFNPNVTYGTLSDNDGNTYKTVQIGTQIWMAENLKTSKYLNGDPIPNNLNATTGAYVIYDNNAVNNTVFGKLYNWYAVDDSRKLCPVGWHIPSFTEWTTLRNFLGGDTVAGGKMKSVSDLWASPNNEASNLSGFSGIPGGFILSLTHRRIGNFGGWWSSSKVNFQIIGISPVQTRLESRNGILTTSSFVGENDFLSVRCIKD